MTFWEKIKEAPESFGSPAKQTIINFFDDLRDASSDMTRKKFISSVKIKRLVTVAIATAALFLVQCSSIADSTAPENTNPLPVEATESLSNQTATPLAAETTEPLSIETAAETQKGYTNPSSEINASKTKHINDYKVREVGPFYNGIARFEVTSYNGKGIVHPSRAYVKGKYGYVNTDGEVIVAPGLTLAPEKFDTPIFAKYQTQESNYMTYLTLAGEMPDFHWPDNDTAYGSGSNGLFWIQTVEKQLSGNIYTMTYYDANGIPLFSIENAMPVNYDRNYGEFSQYKAVDPYTNLSNFNEYGCAFVEVNEALCLVDRTGMVTPLRLPAEGSFTYFSGNNSSGIDIPFSDITRQEITRLNIDPDSFLTTITFNVNFTYSSPLFLTEQINREDWLTFKLDYHTKQLTSFEMHSADHYQRFCHNGESYYLYHFYSDEFLILDKNLKSILSLNDIPTFSGAAITSANPSESGLITVQLKSKDNILFWAVVDMEGNVLIQPTANLVFRGGFSEGLCAVRKDGLWGFFNEKMEWTISPQFEVFYADAFNSGVARLTGYDSNITYIDTAGNIIFTYNK